MNYREVQRFTDSWFGKALVAILFGAFLYVFVSSAVAGKGILEIALFTLPFELSMLILILSKLTTEIDAQGIHYQFSPFHRKRRTLYWDAITACAVRQYSPLREYGGWGIRFGRKGRAFNTGGNKGLQIVLTNRRQILIGTQHEHLVADALKEHRRN